MDSFDHFDNIAYMDGVVANMLYDHAGTAYEVLQSGMDVFLNKSTRAVIGINDDNAGTLTGHLHELVNSKDYSEYDNMNSHVRYRETATESVEYPTENHIDPQDFYEGLAMSLLKNKGKEA